MATGKRIEFRWRSAEWVPGSAAEVRIEIEPSRGGTMISVEFRAWRDRLGELAPELPGWFAGQVVAPVLEAFGPDAVGDGVTDRPARRPSGATARTTYRDPMFHRPNFRHLLHALGLAPEDHLLEVGCGGAFLRDALRSGCRAAAMDHSPEMVRLTRELSLDAIREGRLVVVEADAEWIPYASGRFTCAVTTGVYGFNRDPIAALAELRRMPSMRASRTSASSVPTWTPSLAKPG